MKHLIGMVTFGGLKYTKLAIKHIRKTVTKPYTLYVIVGKPGDYETANWLRSENIPYRRHKDNMGFPASINDIYDFAWKHWNFDTITMIGNDVVPLPHCIDTLMEVAETTDYEWISAREIDVRALIRAYPQTREYFEGPDLILRDFNMEPWNEVVLPNQEDINIQESGLSDCHNLTLFKKSVFDKIGYIDVNFYPAYFSDNDYVRRAVHAGMNSCTIFNSVFFHFWSRTIKEESGGSNDSFFRENGRFYKTKWGGGFGKESFQVPFNGLEFSLNDKVALNPSIDIKDRRQERAIVDYWRSRGV